MPSKYQEPDPNAPPVRGIDMMPRLPSLPPFETFLPPFSFPTSGWSGIPSAGSPFGPPEWNPFWGIRPPSAGPGMLVPGGPPPTDMNGRPYPGLGESIGGPQRPLPPPFGGIGGPQRPAPGLPSDPYGGPDTGPVGPGGGTRPVAIEGTVGGPQRPTPGFPTPGPSPNLPPSGGGGAGPSESKPGSGFTPPSGGPAGPGNGVPIGSPANPGAGYNPTPGGGAPGSGGTPPELGTGGGAPQQPVPPEMGGGGAGQPPRPPEMGVPQTSPFSDVPTSDPFFAAISALANRGAMAGYGNGTFGLNDPITGAQAALVLSKLFPNAGTLQVGGNTPLTRGAMAQLLSGILPGTPAYQNQFLDVPYNAPYAQGVGELASLGITAGTGGGNFNPMGTLTRGQFAQLAQNAFTRFPNLPAPQPQNNPFLPGFSPGGGPAGGTGSNGGTTGGGQSGSVAMGYQNPFLSQLAQMGSRGMNSPQSGNRAAQMTQNFMQSPFQPTSSSVAL